MAERRKKLVYLCTAILALVMFLALDFVTAHRGKNTSFMNAAVAKTVYPATVAIATSADKELPSPVSISSEKVTYAQVDAVVRRALDLDTSDTSIRNVIKPGTGSSSSSTLSARLLPMRTGSAKTRISGSMTWSITAMSPTPEW